MFEPKPGRLIVSCQPSAPDSPLNQPVHMAAMAAAAERAGATAVRVNSPEHVAVVRAACGLPVIGLWKRENRYGKRIITPDFDGAAALAAAGAQVIALDATAAGRPVPAEIAALIRRVQEELRCTVLADVSTLEEGVRAAAYGAEMVATTLSGYTSYSPAQDGPDLALVRALVSAVSVPVVAEGRYARPSQARAALEAGAAFVVVGGAITAPDLLTARFVREMEGHLPEH